MLVVLVPLFLGILQVGLVLFVRNTLAAAASEGARYAATQDRDLADGAARTREQIDEAVSGRFARDVEVRRVVVDGAPGGRGRRARPDPGARDRRTRGRRSRSPATPSRRTPR